MGGAGCYDGILPAVLLTHCMEDCLMATVAIDGLLARVSKPSRYTGGEWNSVVKDWESTNVRIALAYPDAYDIGMSNMGLGILYDILNRIEDVACERVFAPWDDMEAEMRRDGVPLWSLETRHPLREFDLVGFTFQYEMTYTNVLNMLDLAGIPVLSRERTDEDPIVIAGGSGAFNPEPMALFIDAFVLGEGEEVVVELTDLVRNWKREGAPRERRLRDLLRVPGVYVPAFYEARYDDAGHFLALEPTVPEAPRVIRRRIVEKLPQPLVKPIVPFLQTVHDRAAVEIQRGCTQGCRFCQAGMIYRPTRERSPEEVVQAAADLMANTGYDELSLLSLSTTDHSEIVPMVQMLTERFPNLKVSLPSTRVDTFSVDVANAIAKGKKHTLTLAPEAGSQRLRNAINKLVSDADLLGAAENAFQRGWTGIKMYFMVGLPTETMEDVAGIVELGKQVKAIGKKYVGGRARVRVSTSNLVPKPHTPFQWARQDTAEELQPKHFLLKDGCRAAGVEFSWNDPRDSFIEAVLSRGDRRVSEAVYEAWRRGAKFDAWSEHFRFETWQAAFAAVGVDPAWFAHREWDTREPLPWDHIDCGVTKAYLRGQWQAVHSTKTVGDCHHGACNVCGMQNFDALRGEKGVADCVVKVGKLAELRRGARKYEGELLELV
ncbi:TIGR03960 family B12-binding radical SAM protein [Tepidiforma bonchosmolovskayae]|uniref:TIGR03960 family B12-binding radical SAM protein n=2 Tax=Tepidiforma bonchosmolovskayae TaxID=2601677 RepID=A0ABX6BYZ1_9CHLR|nr:TIGR03960 family B12-binding radical SAM protein [Tepidiforma bonchosmolovskayae]